MLLKLYQAIFISYLLFFCSTSLLAQKSTVLSLERDSRISVSTLLRKLESNGIQLVYSEDKIGDLFLVLEKGTYTFDEIKSKLAKTGIELREENSIYLVLTKPGERKYIVSGYVRDKESKEALIGATIQLKGMNKNIISNDYGYYSVTLNPGIYSAVVRHIGYQTQYDTLEIRENQYITFRLQPGTLELNEVSVLSHSNMENILESPPGSHKLRYQEKGTIPYFMGEVDVLQESLLLPGITAVGEDASGLNIRGGNIDQNLYLLDEAIIYNPNHFYGLISVFNPEAVNSVDIFKGYIPAEYGGRASSVISIYQREGNYTKYEASGGVGLASLRATIEGPIVKNKASFLVSGRQSLLDITQIYDQNNSANSRISFQDLNFKLNWKKSNKNTFLLSGYMGNDQNQAGFDAVRNWGNRALTFRWNHTFSRKIFSHFSAVINEYRYRINNPVEAGSFIGRSRIVNYSLKNENYWYISPSTTLKFGISTIFHRLQPGERIPFDENSSQSQPVVLDTEHGLESAAYISGETDLNNWLSVKYGLRFSNFLALGATDKYIYNPTLPIANETIIDTVKYSKWEIFSNYKLFEPRFSLNFKINNNFSIKPAFSRNFQYLHLISNTAAPSPTDIWKLTDNRIKPISSDNYSLGLYYSLAKGKWSISLDTYYKSINNLIDYKDGADLLLNPNIETELLFGNGRAYGLEFFLRKNYGKFSGWMSYTLSRAERQVLGNFPSETINEGNYYPEDFDKTHDLSLVALYQLNNRLSFSSSFNYSTGRPFTFPSGKYFYDNTLVAHFEGRNQNRLSDYHRLDVSAKLLGKLKKNNGKQRKVIDYWTLSIYNVYARKNAYSYFFRESEETAGATEVLTYSIFGTIFPSITYNFRF